MLYSHIKNVFMLCWHITRWIYLCCTNVYICDAYDVYGGIRLAGFNHIQNESLIWETRHCMLFRLIRVLPRNLMGVMGYCGLESGPTRLNKTSKSYSCWNRHNSQLESLSSPTQTREMETSWCVYCKAYEWSASGLGMVALLYDFIMTS